MHISAVGHHCLTNIQVLLKLFAARLSLWYMHAYIHVYAYMYMTVHDIKSLLHKAWSCPSQLHVCCGVLFQEAHGCSDYQGLSVSVFLFIFLRKLSIISFDIGSRPIVAIETSCNLGYMMHLVFKAPFSRHGYCTL